MSAHRTYLSPYHLEGALELHLLVIRQRCQKLYLLYKSNVDIQSAMNGLKVKTPKRSEQIGLQHHQFVWHTTYNKSINQQATGYCAYNPAVPIIMPQSWTPLKREFTCADLTQPVVVGFTVHVVPGAAFIKVMCAEFCAWFNVALVVRFPAYPVQEIQLMNKKQKDILYISMFCHTVANGPISNR